MGDNFDFLDRLRSRYSYLRQYVPRFLAALPVQATPAGQPVLAALNLLRELNATGKRTIPANSPTGFITPRWAPYIFAEQKLDRQYYELHVLAALRTGFRSGELYVAGSRTHKEFEMYVLSSTDWERIKRSGQTGLAVPIDWPTYLAGRGALLHQRLSHINRQIGRENRWLIIGKTARKVFLTIVIGERPEENTYGLITARAARRKERSFYMEYITQGGGEEEDENKAS